MSATRMTAVFRRRKKSIMAPSGCVRVVMTISIGVSAWLVPIFTSVLVSLGCTSFVPMLVGALFAMLVSMFILTVLRLKVEGSQSGDRKCTERNQHGFHRMLHDDEPPLGPTETLRHSTHGHALTV